MKQLFIYTTLFLVFCIGLSACDSTTSPGDIFNEEPVINSFAITPNNIQFSSTTDGIKDTTVQVSFSVSTDQLNEEQNVVLQFFDRIREESFERVMNAGADGNFDLTVDFETRTTFFEEFVVNAMVEPFTTTGYAQGSLKLTGFSEEAPQILFVENEEELQRPAEGQPDEAIGFFAKVTDIEGMDTIDGVFIRLISRESGEVSGSPFRLYDDGSNGDGTPNDSLFTRGFRFGSGNELQTYDVLYYAEDRGGLVSDTVKTTFSIVE